MGGVARAFWSSVMATSAMTLGFFRFFPMLPRSERKPLPPAQLTQSIAQKTLPVKLSPALQQQATLAAHYGYGFACAAVYSAVAPKLSGNAIRNGCLFGSAVWAASYFGLIPAIDGRPQGARMAPSRNAMMLASHLVWGASLGYAEDVLRKRTRQMLTGSRSLES